MRVIDDATVADVLDLGALTDATVAAFASLGRGEAASTLRVRAAAGGGMASALAAVLPERGVSGGKLYSTHGGRFTFVVVTFDLEGRLLAVLEGDTLTALRTAAGTGAAIRLLGGSSARVVTVVGTGRLCRPHLTMLAREASDLVELRLVGRRLEPLAVAAEHARSLGLPVRTGTDPAAAIPDADLVLTLTSSGTPLFPGSALSPGALVCALGATKPGRREVDADCVERAAVVVVDVLDGARIESGDLIQAAAEGRFVWERAVELGEVAAGIRELPSGTGTTLYESQGIALQDVVAAALVLEALA